MRGALLRLVAALACTGCPGGASPDAVDGSVVDPCEPFPGVRITTADGRCACPPGESPRLTFFAPDPPRDFRVCSGVQEGDRCECTLGLRCFEDRVCVDVADSDLFATAGACLAYYELAGRPPPETACRYADLTQASTGTVARSECTDELAAAGLCALGCPCPHGEACFGLSEARSIGVCVDGLLLGFPAPCDPAGVLRAECSNVTPPHACLTARERPEWLERSLWAEDALDAGVDLAGGVCVEAERCARLAALSPETWRCVDLPAL